MRRVWTTPPTGQRSAGSESDTARVTSEARPGSTGQRSAISGHAHVPAYAGAPAPACSSDIRPIPGLDSGVLGAACRIRSSHERRRTAMSRRRLSPRLSLVAPELAQRLRRPPARRSGGSPARTASTCRTATCSIAASGIEIGAEHVAHDAGPTRSPTAAGAASPPRPARRRSRAPHDGVRRDPVVSPASGPMHGHDDDQRSRPREPGDPSAGRTEPSRPLSSATAAAPSRLRSTGLRATLCWRGEFPHRCSSGSRASAPPAGTSRRSPAPTASLRRFLHGLPGRRPGRRRGPGRRRSAPARSRPRPRRTRSTSPSGWST